MSIEEVITKQTEAMAELTKATIRQAGALERIHRLLESEGFKGRDAIKEQRQETAAEQKKRRTAEAKAAAEELRAKKAAEEAAAVEEDVGPNEEDLVEQQAADEAKSKAHTDKQRAEQKANGADPDDWGDDDSGESLGLTIDDVRKAVAPLGKTKGLALLAKFNAKRMSDLDPSDYEAVVAAAKGE